MNLQDPQPLQEVRAFRLRSEEYLNNAYASLALNELEKASEFAWEAMAQAVKAVAALKGIALLKHRAPVQYALQLARELGDQSILQDFRQAQSLHSNFYESGLAPEEVAESLESIRTTTGKLLSLLPEEAHRR